MPFLHACLAYFQYHELEELSLVKRHSYLIKVVAHMLPERRVRITQCHVFSFTSCMCLFQSCLGSEVASVLAFPAHFKALRGRCIFKDKEP